MNINSHRQAIERVCDRFHIEGERRDRLINEYLQVLPLMKKDLERQIRVKIAGFDHATNANICAMAFVVGHAEGVVSVLKTTGQTNPVKTS